jgi:hypothetical protein
MWTVYPPATCKMTPKPANGGDVGHTGKNIVVDGSSEWRSQRALPSDFGRLRKLSTVF